MEEKPITSPFGVVWALIIGVGNNLLI